MPLATINHRDPKVPELLQHSYALALAAQSQDPDTTLDAFTLGTTQLNESSTIRVPATLVTCNEAYEAWRDQWLQQIGALEPPSSADELETAHIPHLTPSLLRYLVEQGSRPRSKPASERKPSQRKGKDSSSASTEGNPPQGPAHPQVVQPS